MVLFNLVSAAMVTIGVAARYAALVVVGLESAALLLTRNSSGRPPGRLGQPSRHDPDPAGLGRRRRWYP